jgi:hypothetical protein
VTRGWISVSSRNRLSEVPVYVFATAGLVYAVQMYVKGGA